MSRKQVVLIEWIVLILLLAGLLGLGIFGIRRLISGRASDGNPQENGKETGRYEEEGDTKASDTEDLTESITVSPKEEEKEYSYTFSFAGDCTIGSLMEWQGSMQGDFQSVVGTNYSYPLSGVRDIFSADDLTVVNLEGTFTNSVNAVGKPYRFKGDPAYVKVLTEGSVEAVSSANNHSGDFMEEGIADTIAALQAAGIRYTKAADPIIMELEGGLRLGIVSYNTVENLEGEAAWRASVQTDIAVCRQAGCNLIIGFMHWGTVEYLTKPEDWEVAFAHDMVDWGCDLIVGGHAHILQRMEYYNNVPIFYSMGNFCYGGNLNPDDKDSANQNTIPCTPKNEYTNNYFYK